MEREAQRQNERGEGDSRGGAEHGANLGRELERAVGDGSPVTIGPTASFAVGRGHSLVRAGFVELSSGECVG
ncbi:hypothetical protein WQQ_26750 [Hydrocarboniphaga effusa AP103]|uniref:Uncharacterized protein n=1 Tax=Hydrocarboniphaga effusa AP103 TaxID=1172194 RepID=I8T5U2_9GAMM|nr:hypothetical protein WQQ_26750 [Hydrocarboniphaga effusa AP103]